MTFAAKFGMAHGAVLRTARPAKPVADVFETETLERTEARVFTLFPERTATVQNESRESARRKACLIGMCAPTCVFLSLAAWYLAL